MGIELPWDPQQFRDDLQDGAGLITVGGIHYLCYAEVAAHSGTFVGVRANCHHTFCINPVTGTVAQVVPSDTLVTVSAHYIEAGKFLRRLRRCTGVTSEADIREAVSQLFTSGLAVPSIFCKELSALLGIFSPLRATADLQNRLNEYASDLQGSARLRQTCAESLQYLIEQLGREEP
jgi:hypothetical protein